MLHLVGVQMGQPGFFSSLGMSLTVSSSFCDKTFRTAATDSGRAGSLLLNLVDTLDLHVVL